MAFEQFPSEPCQSCDSTPVTQSRISLGHGGGGRLSQALLEDIIRPSFGSDLQGDSDSALVEINGQLIAFTTDSYVVRPRFFPGGDIGSLAVTGTANDLAMVGAKPTFFSCALVIEEGFDQAELQSILGSMQRTAVEIGAPLVTGDTKVVEKGCADGLYINTTGVGALQTQQRLHPDQITPGQDIIISGDLGRHGAAVIAARDGIEAPDLASDCAFLGVLTEPLVTNFSGISCFRDITRGGLAACLNECAVSAKLSFMVDESQIPINDCARSICDLMGYDPLHLANEGRFVLFCDRVQTPAILDWLKSQALGVDACVIGSVCEKHWAPVVVRTLYGSERVLPSPSGELLSRIC